MTRAGVGVDGGSLDLDLAGVIGPFGTLKGDTSALLVNLLFFGVALFVEETLRFLLSAGMGVAGVVRG